MRVSQGCLMNRCTSRASSGAKPSGECTSRRTRTVQKRFCLPMLTISSLQQRRRARSKASSMVSPLSGRSVSSAQFRRYSPRRSLATEPQTVSGFRRRPTSTALWNASPASAQSRSDTCRYPVRSSRRVDLDPPRSCRAIRNWLAVSYGSPAAPDRICHTPRRTSRGSSPLPLRLSGTFDLISIECPYVRICTQR